MPFSITFEYIPGSQNIVFDALSRYPNLMTNACMTLVAPQLVGLVSRIALAAQQDAEYQAMILKIQKTAENQDVQGGGGESSNQHDLLQNNGIPVQGGTVEDENPNSFTLQDGVLFTSEGQIVLPKEDELRTLVISEAHDSPLGGHFGHAKTLEKVRRLWQ